MTAPSLTDGTTRNGAARTCTAPFFISDLTSHMSTPLLNLDLSEALPSEPVAPARPPSPKRAWLREPLLHFIVLGGSLFAADYALAGKRDDSHSIVVTADVDSEAVETF